MSGFVPIKDRIAENGTVLYDGHPRVEGKGPSRVRAQYQQEHSSSGLPAPTAQRALSFSCHPQRHELALKTEMRKKYKQDGICL